MIRNPNYVVSKSKDTIPSHLNFGRYIVDMLYSHGDKIALTNGANHKTLSFSTLLRDTISVAVSLRQLGVRKGDVMAICMEGTFEFWPFLLGGSCIGAILQPVNVLYTPDELKHIWSITKPKYLFCSSLTYKLHSNTFKSLPYLEKIISIGGVDHTFAYEELLKKTVRYEDFEPVDVEGSDTLFVLNSSGTTGLPKGVMLSHYNIISTISTEAAYDCSLLTLTITPWFHVMGLVGILSSFKEGVRTVYLPKFDTHLYLQSIEKYKINQLLLAPPVLVTALKLDKKYDVSSVIYIFSGAAPLDSATILEAKKKFVNVKAILQGYGLTETTFAVIRDSIDKQHMARPGGIGFLTPGCTAKIVDIESRQVLGANQVGEILLKGSFIMKGYVGKEKSEDFDDEGFYKTGDIGYYNDDRYFFLVDRLKELIKYKGYQVPPAEIEAVLIQHPGIRDAGVVAVPHAEAGEVPRAFVVLQPGIELKEAEICAYVASKLSNPKHLRGGVQYISEIPKNLSGKILRRKLREMIHKRSNL